MHLALARTAKLIISYRMALRVTLAMEAGLTNHVWSIEELITAALAEPDGEPPKPKSLQTRPEAGGAARCTSTGVLLRAVPNQEAPRLAVPGRRAAIDKST